MPGVDLMASTLRLFEECAADYIRGDLHWGGDIDVLLRAASTYPSLRVVDLGSGSCWHLGNLLRLLSGCIKRAYAVDASHAMIDEAKHSLGLIRCNGKTLADQISFYLEDIRETSIEHGNVELAMMMNNTIGNITGADPADSAAERLRALVHANQLLVSSGLLVLSVYDVRKLQVPSSYMGVFTIDLDLSDFETGDIVVRYTKTGTPCYSHWFRAEELKSLIEQAGFSIVAMEHRHERIVVSCSKSNTSVGAISKDSKEWNTQ